MLILDADERAFIVGSQELTWFKINISCGHVSYWPLVGTVCPTGPWWGPCVLANKYLFYILDIDERAFIVFH